MRLNSGILIGLIFAISANSATFKAVCNTYCADSCNLSIDAEIKNVSCNGHQDGSIDLNVSGNETCSFLWNNGSTHEDIYHIGAGKYTVTIKAGNCNVSRSFVVNEPPVLQLISDNFKNVACPGGNDGEVYVHALGGTSPYIFTLMDSLTNPEGVFINLDAGIYTIGVKDFYRCKSELIVEIEEPEKYTVIPGNNLTVFSGEEFILDGGDSFLEYKWSNGEITQKISAILYTSEPFQQKFSVEVKDQNGCWHTSEEITISIIPQPASDYNDTILLNNF
ncbi:MAG: SprB repeat-containing protein [Bacteroidales bacterium]